jgi:hypothetical protein
MAAITVASHTVVRGLGISEAAPDFTSVLEIVVWSERLYGAYRAFAGPIWAFARIKAPGINSAPMARFRLKEPLGARSTTFFKSIAGTCRRLKPARTSRRSTLSCLRTLATSTRITGADLVDVVETLNKPFRGAVVRGLTSSESSWKLYFGAGVSLLSCTIPRDCMVVSVVCRG